MNKLILVGKVQVEYQGRWDHEKDKRPCPNLCIISQNKGEAAQYLYSDSPGEEEARQRHTKGSHIGLGSRRIAYFVDACH